MPVSRAADSLLRAFSRGASLGSRPPSRPRRCRPSPGFWTRNTNQPSILLAGIVNSNTAVRRKPFICRRRVAQMSRARRCRPVAAKAPRRCVRPSAPLKFGRTGTPPCRRALPDTGGAGSGGGLAAEADGRRDAVGCKARTSFVGPPAPPCCALARLVPFLTDCLQRVPVQVPVPGIPNAASAVACLRPPRHGASGMSCPHWQNPLPAGRPAS